MNIRIILSQKCDYFTECLRVYLWAAGHARRCQPRCSLNMTGMLNGFLIWLLARDISRMQANRVPTLATAGGAGDGWTDLLGWMSRWRSSHRVRYQPRGAIRVMVCDRGSMIHLLSRHGRTLSGCLTPIALPPHEGCLCLEHSLCLAGGHR